MNKFFVVFSHTYISRLKSKSFIISTLVMLLVITLLANVETIIERMSKEETPTIIVIDETDLFSELKRRIEEREAPLRLKAYNRFIDEGKQEVKEEKYEGLLFLSFDDEKLPQATFYENRATSFNNEQVLERQLQQIKEDLLTERAGIDEATLANIYAPIAFQKVPLDQKAKTDEELQAARGIVYVMLFVLYMSVIIYGQMIAADVAVEKSSRVMELLISSAPPLTHMFAKIFGIGLLGITQMGIAFFYGLVTFRSKSTEVTQEVLQEFGFTAQHVSLYLYALIFFILGYLLYATLAAMLGSLVSRVEDVQQLTLPLALLVMLAFFIALFGLVKPESMLITVTSFIPFFTPMIMFLRIGMLEVPAWEIALSIGLTVLTLILCSILAARVYRGGVLMYGSSHTWKDFYRALQLSKRE